MKGKLNPHIIAAGTFIVFVVLGLACASSSTPPGEILYSQPPSRPILTSQQRENLTEADIDLLIQKGDEAYENEKYSVAKDFYYEVLLAMPNPSGYVLVSYGACLANLQSYENAITIFNLALEKNPDNEVAKENIRICRQLIAAQTAEQRRLEQEQERQQQENFNNLIDSLNSMATVAGNLQSQQSQSGGSTGGGNTGRQGQAGTSSGTSSGGSIASNPALAQRTYNNYARAAKEMYNNILNAIKSNEPASRINELVNTFENTKKQMNDYRKRAQQQGVTITADEYETKASPKR